jgi:hypothetical protein
MRVGRRDRREPAGDDGQVERIWRRMRAGRRDRREPAGDDGQVERIWRRMRAKKVSSSGLMMRGGVMRMVRSL